MTRNNGRTLFGETKQLVLNHELSVNNFEYSFDFPVVYSFNFDPGGDKSSPAANYGGNHSIFSLLLLPWDRGKMVFSSFLFPVANLAPAMVSFPVRGAASGWPWVPWSSMKMTASVATTSAKHVKEEEAVMVNGKLKSIKFSIDLMGLYVGLLHFHTGPKLLRIWELGIIAH
jgi:hypothetical protein